MLVLAVLVAVVALLCWFVVWGGDLLLQRLSGGGGNRSSRSAPAAEAPATDPTKPPSRRRRRADRPAEQEAGPRSSVTPPAPSSTRAGPPTPEVPPPGLQLQALDPAVRETYQQSWQRTLERFQEDPQPALVAAEQLVTLLLDERGYPTEGPGRLADTTKDPAGVLPDYLAAHQVISADEPSSSEMRKAMEALNRTVSTLLDDRPRAQQR